MSALVEVKAAWSLLAGMGSECLWRADADQQWHEPECALAHMRKFECALHTNHKPNVRVVPSISSATTHACKPHEEKALRTTMSVMRPSLRVLSRLMLKSR